MHLDRTLTLEWPHEKVGKRKKNYKKKKTGQDSDDLINSDSDRDKKDKKKVKILFGKY